MVETEGTPGKTRGESVTADVIVVTGFLGAGKTTLINKFLEDGFGVDGTVLIENEFGEIPIDGDLVAESGVNMRLLSTGCICCTLKGDFEKNMVEVVETLRPERILVEPTGLSDIDDFLGIIEELSEALPIKLGAAITVVNAQTLLPTLAIGGEFFARQIERAAFIVMSCADLVDGEQLSDTLDAVGELANDGVAVLSDPWDSLDALEIVALAEQSLQDVRGWARDGSFADGHSHTSICGPIEGDCGCHVGKHDRDHHHDLTDRYESISFSPVPLMSASEVDEMAEVLAGGIAGTVLRAKGFVEVDGSMELFECVYGTCTRRPSLYVGETKMVVIGRELDRELLRGFLGGEVV